MEASADQFGICEGDGTLLGAINAADEGQVILVPEGTYPGGIEINICVVDFSRLLKSMIGFLPSKRIFSLLCVLLVPQ